MNYKIYLIAVFIWILGDNVRSQGFTVTIDKVTIVNSDDYGFHYIHNFQAKETVYSISKLFGTSPNEIYSINPGLEGRTINLNEEVKIPIRSRYIITDQSQLVDKGNYLPVYYEVQPKENLYRISRHYFKQPVETLMANNKMKANDLSPGQELLVGWISRDRKNVVAEKKEIADSINLVRKNEIFTDSKEPQVIDGVVINEETNDVLEKVLIKSRGKAFWDTKSTDKTNLFVLHSKAKKNSFVELINPMLDRRVFAKVVGKIPSDLYPDDIVILVSPKVAEMLGAKDSKFLIEMKYLE